MGPFLGIKHPVVGFSIKEQPEKPEVFSCLFVFRTRCTRFPEKVLLGMLSDRSTFFVGFYIGLFKGSTKRTKMTLKGCTYLSVQYKGKKGFFIGSLRLRWIIKGS